ncbi:metal ABC transporter permease [Campylobacter lari]|nr:metal ABC transporter permease [Campylobacter lari]MCV3398742.1 metal ABC transporter permease [Campylobacter lari]MCV3413930.1 metal ABC transporter permease [Campylobacter lari]
MLELLNFNFFQNAIISSILISIACGCIGSLIMINRLFSMAGGITHGAFGGIGIAFYFSLPVLLSTSLFTVILAFLVAYLSKHYPHRSDSIIAVIWAFGMAMGIILIDLSPGYSSDLMAYLFGSILAVSYHDIWLMAGIDYIFIVVLLCFYRQFEIISFDSEFAQTRGVNVNLFYYILILMISLCIVISIRLVGLILVIALLSIPSFIAEGLSKKLGWMMFYSSVLSFCFCLVGLISSYYFNLSSGACIIISACVAFVLYLCFRVFAKKS